MLDIDPMSLLWFILGTGALALAIGSAIFLANRNAKGLVGFLGLFFSVFIVAMLAWAGLASVIDKDITILFSLWGDDGKIGSYLIVFLLAYVSPAYPLLVGADLLAQWFWKTPSSGLAAEAKEVIARTRTFLNVVPIIFGAGALLAFTQGLEALAKISDAKNKEPMEIPKSTHDIIWSAYGMLLFFSFDTGPAGALARALVLLGLFLYLPGLALLGLNILMGIVDAGNKAKIK